MRFRVLGSLEVRLGDGREVTIRGARLRSLVSLLALDAGRVVSSTQLLTELYGADPPPGVVGALQRQVSRLRAVLDVPVEWSGGGYRLVVDPRDVDLHEFERMVREARDALMRRDHSRAYLVLGEALALWRGPALADVGDVPAARVAELAELRLVAVEDRAEAALALGEHDAVVAELRAVVAAQPVRERACALLMRALCAAGRPAEALAAYAELRRELAERLGADPAAEPARLHRAILTGELPAIRRTGRRPVQLTSFVGRDAELASLRARLASARLVTVTGPGGVGKTRLATEVVADQPDVWFVDLAGHRGDTVVHAVLDGFGVRENGLLDLDAPADPVERLSAWLGDRRAMLVLDNCEHALDAVAMLVSRLLGICPRLRVLATSREPIGIVGETHFPLRPLPEPAAVRLLTERALAVRPDFVVDDATVHVCRALDGLPMAIELAAACLRSLSATELAARLDDRFALLAQGNRAAAPRHRTLRAVVAWSWELLSEDERTAAARLAVFAGGATVAAAKEVTGTSARLLARLVDKSLVEEVDGRYRMLDTVRAFCAERMVHERESLRHAHATYFLRLAESCEPHLLSADQRERLAVLAAEEDNFTTAVSWAVGADAELALRLVAALTTYWLLSGRLGRSALATEVLKLVGDTPPAGLGEDYVLCVIEAYLGGWEPHSYLPSAQRVLDEDDEPPRRAVISLLWPLIAGEAAMPLVRRSLRSRDPWVRAAARTGRGMVCVAAGELVAAERELAAALDVFRALGERLGLAPTLAHLGRLVSWRGDHERGVALLGETVVLLDELGASAKMALMLCDLGEARLRAGDHAVARADFERAAEIAVRAAAPLALATARHGLGELARLSGDHASARRWQMAVLAATANRPAAIRHRALVTLARVAEAEGNAAEARQWLHDPLVRPGDADDAALAAEALAGVALLDGGGERAALLLGAGSALRGTSRAGDPDVARIAAAATEIVGPARFSATHASGASLSREDALTCLGDEWSASGP